jgi:hypothetical protein
LVIQNRFSQIPAHIKHARPTLNAEEISASKCFLRW